MSLEPTPILVNAAMHEAESRSLWRAVYAATIALANYPDPGVQHDAALMANIAVDQYAERFPAKPRKERHEP
jgi:hypothetical protein